MASADDLIFARNLDEVEDFRRKHAERARAGEEQRVALGVYTENDIWQQASRDERYRLKVLGMAQTRRGDPVFSFWSAAVLHGLPIDGSWPAEVHTTVGRAGGGRSSGSVVRHVIPLFDDEIVEVEGLRVTSVARTALDLATRAPFMSAVVSLDRALHVDRRGGTEPLATLEELRELYDRRMPFRGHRRVQKVMRAGTGLSDSVLESISRVNMGKIGCPKPVLQQRFEDYRGIIGESEFSWPEFAKVGESDGMVKYLDPVMRRGRSLEQVLLDEKNRADRMRAIGLDVIRWGWDIGRDPHALQLHLTAAGLPMGVPW
jgi:hypothetical protein